MTILTDEIEKEIKESENRFLDILEIITFAIILLSGMCTFLAFIINRFNL